MFPKAFAFRLSLSDREIGKWAQRMKAIEFKDYRCPTGGLQVGRETSPETESTVRGRDEGNLREGKLLVKVWSVSRIRIE